MFPCVNKRTARIIWIPPMWCFVSADFCSSLKTWRKPWHIFTEAEVVTYSLSCRWLQLVAASGAASGRVSYFIARLALNYSCVHIRRPEDEEAQWGSWVAAACWSAEAQAQHMDTHRDQWCLSDAIRVCSIHPFLSALVLLQGRREPETIPADIQTDNQSHSHFRVSH